MKRNKLLLTVIVLALVACLALVFAACGDKDGVLPADTDTSTVDAASGQTGDPASSGSISDPAKGEGAGDSTNVPAGEDGTSDGDTKTDDPTNIGDGDPAGQGGTNTGDDSGTSDGGDPNADLNPIPESAASLLRRFGYTPATTENGATAISLTNFTMIEQRELAAGYYLVTKYLFAEEGFGSSVYYLISGFPFNDEGLTYYKKGADGWTRYTPYTTNGATHYKSASVTVTAIADVFSNSALLALPVTAKTVLFDPANYAIEGDGYKYIGDPVRAEVQSTNCVVKIDTFSIADDTASITGSIAILVDGEESASSAFTVSLSDVGTTAVEFPAPFVPTEEEPIEGVTTADIANAASDIQTYLNAWAIRNATDSARSQAIALKKALNSDKAKFGLYGVQGSISPLFDVTYEDGVYTVVATWDGDTVSETLHVDAQVLNYGPWAGKHSKTSDYTYLDAIDTYDVLAAAFANTVNKVTGNAVTGKFGLDGVIGFDAFGVSYGLRVKGNIDLTSAKDTELGIIIVDGEGKELYGFYYEGAESAEDSRFYLQYPGANGAPVYRYLDYADLLGWIGSLLSPEAEAAAGALTYTDKDGKTVSIDTFVGLLEAFGASSQVQAIVPSILGMVVNPYYDGAGRYLFDVNLSSMLSTLSGMLSLADTKLIASLQTDYGIDLATMHGIFGHVSLSVKIEDGELTDAELAVNIPESTFYFSADESENAKKFDIPAIGIALYLEDFRFLTDGKIENVIPAEASDAAYFSATNVDLSGDVYIDTLDNTPIDTTYHVDFVTDVNLLEILAKGEESTPRAVLIIKEHAGKIVYSEENAAEWSCFFALSYAQETKTLTLRGTALDLGDDGETLYAYTIGEDTLDDVLTWLGITDMIGLDSDDELLFVINDDKENGPAKPSARAIFGNKLVQELLRYYLTLQAEGEEIEPADDHEEDLVEEHYEEEPFDENDLYEEDENEDLEEDETYDESDEDEDLWGDDDFDEEFDEDFDEDFDEEESLSFNDVLALYGGIKELYETLRSKGIVRYEGNPFSLSVNLNEQTIPELLAVVNGTLGMGISFDDLETLKIEVNSEGYEDMVYFKLKLAEYVVEATLDGSEANRFVATFLFDNGDNAYSLVIDATYEDAVNVSVSYEVLNGEGSTETRTVIDCMNLRGEWSYDTTERANTLIAEAADFPEYSDIFPADGTGPATKLAARVLGYLASDDVYPTALKIGKFLIATIL